MSEAELHILAGRLQGAKRAAAARGELRFPLPVGYVRDADGATIIDPDQEVAAAVADVFAAFQATGSAYGVVASFKQRRFPRRAYGGAWAGELRWGRLTHSRVLWVLSNPAYAGAYVFGRFRSRRIVAADGSVRETTREQPRSDWAVVIQQHHAGYLSWEQYLLNQQRLAANATRSGARPPREGAALCQGILYCGSCGRGMSTNYRLNGRADYECAHSRADHVATAACRVIDAATIDRIVAARLLQVLSPEEVALALAAALGMRPPGAAAPASWLGSGPATKPLEPSEHSTPVNQRTAWSHAAWKTAGRANWPWWRKLRPRWPVPEPHSRRCHRERTWKRWRATCQPCGQHPPPRPKIVSGCYAPWSLT